MLKEVKGRDDQNAIVSTFLGVSFCQGNNIYVYTHAYMYIILLLFGAALPFTNGDRKKYMGTHP